MTYSEFLQKKRIRATTTGIPADRVGPLHKTLFPFQRDVTSRMCSQGRGAIFAGCGLGKSAMAIEWAWAVSRETDKPVMILTPLAVASQFVREGERLGRRVLHVREPRDMFDGARVVVTNYERLDKFEQTLCSLGGVVLDESSILKAFDGKTRTKLIESFGHLAFRLCATATPSPNDVVELGNHAEFLGIMTRAEMLATWFTHDGGETQKWRLKGHAVKDFWRWVCTWAVCLSTPSDLGYSNEGYDLPPLTMHEHVVDVDQEMARGAGLLFAYEAATLQDQRAVRKSSLAERVAKAAALINASDEQWTVWCELNDESEALAKAIDGAVEVTGSDTAEFKERTILDFIDRRVRVLVTKSDIAGFGVNMQNCRNMLFPGVGHSFEKFYQTVRRHYRFGQRREVHCHVVSTSADGRVVANLARKQRDAETMQQEMVMAMNSEAHVGSGAPAPEETQGDLWAMTLGDCVDVLRRRGDDGIDFSVYSPPFASLYTYSDSEADMGNCKSHEEFFEQYRYLLAELLRVTKPGRLSSVHCMTLPTSKTRDGVIGLTDFPGKIIAAHEDAGWIFHSKVTIWKDPVTAMQRTKALGLLHKQLLKDSCMSRMGIPDEVLTFRKPGVNAEPVKHRKPMALKEHQELHTSGEHMTTVVDMFEPNNGAGVFGVDQWQKWASPVWGDINPSDTLQYMSAREEADERHICPLQLEVIRRCVRLWSNPGDLVLSPFAGIGSEGYVALEEGRRYVGVELKRSYWEQACANLRAVESRPRILFG